MVKLLQADEEEISVQPPRATGGRGRSRAGQKSRARGGGEGRGRAMIPATVGGAVGVGLALTAALALTGGLPHPGGRGRGRAGRRICARGRGEGRGRARIPTSVSGAVAVDAALTAALAITQPAQTEEETRRVTTQQSRRKKCDICGKDFAYYGSLRNHRNRVHPDADPLPLQGTPPLPPPETLPSPDPLPSPDQGRDLSPSIRQLPNRRSLLNSPAQIDIIQNLNDYFPVEESFETQQDALPESFLDHIEVTSAMARQNEELLEQMRPPRLPTILPLQDPLPLPDLLPSTDPLPPTSPLPSEDPLPPVPSIRTRSRRPLPPRQQDSPDCPPRPEMVSCHKGKKCTHVVIFGEYHYNKKKLDDYNDWMDKQKVAGECYPSTQNSRVPKISIR